MTSSRPINIVLVTLGAYFINMLNEIWLLKQQDWDLPNLQQSAIKILTECWLYNYLPLVHVVDLYLLGL